MTEVTRIFAWLHENAGTISAVVAILALLVAILIGLFGQGLIPTFVRRWREKRVDTRSRKYRHELPARVEHFGRRDLVRDLCRAAGVPIRLILEGPRGTGKSSVGLEIAYQICKQKDRAVWVDLKHAEYSREDFIDKFAQHLAVSVDGLPSTGEKMAAVQAALAHRHGRSLLIVDNFESVIPNDRAAVLALLDRLPATVAVLVTTSAAVPYLHNMQLRHIGELLYSEAREILVGEISADPALENLGLDEDDLRRIFRDTGGNALAMKWTLGRLRNGMALNVVLEPAIDSGEVSNELFGGAWAGLSSDARSVAALIAQINVDPSMELLRCVRDGAVVVSAVEELLGSNLLERVASNGRHYQGRFAMHPLARAYVRDTSSTRLDVQKEIDSGATRYIELYGENGTEEDMALCAVDFPQIIASLRSLIGRRAWAQATTLAVASEETMLTLGLLGVRRDLCLQVAPHAVETEDRPWRSRLTVVGAQAAGLLNQYELSNEALESVIANPTVKSMDQKRRARRALAANLLRSNEDLDVAAVISELECDASETQDHYLRIDILYLLANISYNSGNMWESIRYCDNIDTEVNTTGDYNRALAYSGEQRGLAYLELWKLWRSAREIRSAARVASKFADVRQAARINLVRAKSLMLVGRIRRGRDLAMSAEARFATLGLINEQAESRAVWNSSIGTLIRMIGRQELPRLRFSNTPIGGD